MDDWDVTDNLDCLPKPFVDDLLYKYDASYFPLSNGKLWAVGVDDRVEMRKDYFTKRNENKYTILIDSTEYTVWIIDFETCGSGRCWCDIPTTLYLKVADQTSIYPRWIMTFESTKQKDEVSSLFFQTDAIIPLSDCSLDEALMTIDLGFNFRCKSFEYTVALKEECDLCGNTGNIRMNCCNTNDSSKWVCRDCFNGLSEDEKCPWCREPFCLSRHQKDKRWDPFIKDLCST